MREKALDLGPLTDDSGKTKILPLPQIVKTVTPMQGSVLLVMERKNG